MSNQTRGRGLVLHFDGSHWILREGRSWQQMSLYPDVIFYRRKIAFIMHEFWKSGFFSFPCQLISSLPDSSMQGFFQLKQNLTNNNALEFG